MDPARTTIRSSGLAAIGVLGLAGSTLAVPGAAAETSVPHGSRAVVGIPVNSAPTLSTATPGALGTIVEGQAASDPGTLLENLTVQIYGEADNRDPHGVAITAADNANGTWEYTTDNSAQPPVWTAIGSVSDAHALLLHVAASAYNGGAATSAAVRFRPSGHFNTLDMPQAMLTLRAWDESDGLAASSAGSPSYSSTAGTNGGTTAYSSGALPCQLTVSQVNEAAPVLDPGTGSALLPTYFGEANPPGTPVAVLLSRTGVVSDLDDPYGDHGIAITGFSASVPGTWQYTIDGGATWLNVSRFRIGISATNALLLASGVDRYASRNAGVSTVLDTRVRFLPSNATFTGTISTAISFRAWDQSDWLANSATSGLTESTAVNGGTSPFSTAIRSASLTIYDASGRIPTVPVTVPAIPLSGGGAVYTPLCPSTAAGEADLLAAFSGRSRSQVRGFTWDPTLLGGQGDYVELPALPSGGLQPSTGVFLATRTDLGLDFSGVPFAMPYAITLQPGWNLVGVPPLADGTGGILLTHPWVDFELRDSTGTAILSDPQFTQVLGDPLQPTLTSTTEPFLWDGTAYRQVTQLETGKGYWIKNNATTVYTINRIGTASTPNPRLAGSPGAAPRGAAPKSASGPFVDRGSPPPPPADTSSGAHAQGRSCGHGSGIAAFAVMAMLALRAFSMRLAARRR